MLLPMKRAIAFTALVAGLAVALAGCRAGRGATPAEQPQRPAAGTVSASTGPAPAAQQPGGPAVQTDLTDVDALLRELDDQLSKAEQTPADGD
jgi:hypothetical protein